ncbi:IgGFc-binding protein, partial [Dokdonia pacifica]
MRIKNYLVLLFLFLSTLPSLAQLGSTHYIPPLHGRISITDATVYLSTPFPTPINVTISRGDGTVLTTLTISQGNPAIYEPDLFANSPIVVQNSELNTPIADKGLILESTELFYVSLRTYNFNHAGYLTAKGEDALGQSFRLGSCPLNPNNSAHSFFASIMATEDNTSITFSDYDAANMTFENGLNPNPTLNAGETFVVSGYSGDPDNNEGFIGALLTADKPIVVNSGNLRGTMPNPDTSAANWSDHMIDQIVDESATGFEYMLIRGGGNPVSERPLIIANQDNTEIFVNGNPIGVTLNTGEYTILDNDNLYLPADPNAVHRNMYISTNDDTKSIYVYQFLAGRSGTNDQTITPPDVPDATPGMNFIPPLSCFFQNDVDLIPAVDEIYPNSIEDYVGNLLITSRVGNTVTVNGTVIPVGDALGNPGTPDWETYFLEDQMGDISIIADGPIAVGLFGSDNRDVAQGLGGSAGFGGYYSGFAVTPEDTETDVCTNAGPINLLDRFDGNPPTGGTWTPALNSGTDIFDPLTDPISNPSLVYNYVAIGECDPIDVDITITLVDAPALNPIPNIDACETFSLPDPSTIAGNFLNNPQYYDGPQISPTTNLIDWTIPITTTTTIFIFDEVEADPDNCTDELSFTITVNDFAIANPVPDQIVCDDPTNDGLAIFNLTPLAATVLGTQSPLSYTVTFHTTPLDATNGTAPIATPGAYQAGTSTIFARIENNLSAICFDTTPINLIVDILPVINQVPDQINCDDPSNDGLEVFDLDGLIPFIIAPFTLAEVEVSFHLSQNDADNDVAPLTTAGGYNSPNDEIFIRVENIANTSCFDTSSFMVIVNQRPIPVDPGPFVVCDNTADGSDTNGFVEFNLGSLNNTILGTQDPTQFTLTYHIDANDALLDQSPLPLFFTNTIVGGQPIFVRLENDNFTDCFTVISFDLVVGALPVIINPAPLLTQCDIDNDGFAVFNLTEGEVLISADFVNETFQYFDQAGNSIADPIAYTNAIVNNETIDVIVSTVNGCTRPAQLLLEVDTSQIPANFLLEYTACDTDGDLVSVFDFSDATAQVLALFPAGQLLTVSYYETLQEAQSEVNAIPDISNYTNNIALTDVNGVQGIYVRVDGDTANDCIGLGIHVQLTVLPNPVLNTDVTDFVECSDDGVFGIFDLTSKDIEITGGNPDYVVSYYASLADYTAVPPIAIPNPTIYPNTSEPQTIYYSAVNTITGCSTFDEVNLFFELFINENPTTVLPTDLIICDEDGTPDGLTTIDLTVKNAEITGGFDPTVTVSYHLTLAGANVNDASIPDPTMFTNTTNIQIVFARVTNNITGCFSTEPLRIEVFLLPVPVVPADLEVCDVDNDGIFDFFILSDV